MLGPTTVLFLSSSTLFKKLTDECYAGNCSLYTIPWPTVILDYILTSLGLH